MKMRFVPRVIFLFIAVIAVRAQSVWTGSSSGSFNSSTNWSSGFVPVSGATSGTTDSNLVFGATSNSSIAISNVLPFTANSITFNGSYPHYVFNDNGGTLTIGAGGITLDSTGSTSGSSNVDFNSSLVIALGASQTWTTSGPTHGNLTVSSNISGGYAVTKAGSGYLALTGTNTFNAPTISAGTLYLGQASSAGSGTITVGGSGALAVVGSDVTLSNAISVSSSGATLGGSLSGGNAQLKLSGLVTVPSGASTLNVAGSEVSFTGSLTAAAANANLTVRGTGTAIAILGNTTANISSMIADNAGIAFGNTTTLPTSSVQASNGGYVSIAALGGTTTTPSVTTLLGLINNASGGNPGFNGIIGFDTSKSLDAPHVFSGDINLTGFTAGNVSLSSSTGAVISGNITLPSGATSYDFKGFGTQGGILVVTSNLTNNGGATGITVTSPAATSGIGSGGTSIILQGNNTLMTGNLSVTQSGVILDSANALPSKNIAIGANSYAGITESASYSNFADLQSHIQSGYVSTSVIGLDSHTPLGELISTGNMTSAVRAVTDAFDLSSMTAISLGTVTGVTINSDSTIKAPSDGALRLVSFGGGNGNFTINPVLTSANVTSVVLGTSGSEGAIVLNGANTYAGGTSLQGGAVFVGDNSAFGSGNIVVSSTSAIGNADSAAVIGAAAGSITLTNNIAVTNFLALGNGKYDDNGNFSAGTTNLTLSGTISNNVTNGRVYYTSPTTINGSNTYSGGTYVLADTTVNTDTGLGTNFVDLGYNAVLTFTSTNPVIGGGSLADASAFLGSAAGSGTIKLGAGVSTLTINQTSSGASFSGQITGTSGASSAALIKSGSGQLSLAGDNAGQWTGGTTINAGTLAVGNGTSTTASFGGNVVLAGGTLAFQPAASTNLTFAGNISATSATGGVAINGSTTGNVFITSGTNTFNGSTTITSGTLRIMGDDLWSSASQTTVNAGAKLQLDGSQTIKNLGGSGNVTIVSTGKTLTVNSTSSTAVSGVISGSGGLTKIGVGQTFTLSGANTYSGTTTISQGTLQVGTGGTTGSLTSDIINNANLIFNRSDATTYAGAISGATGTVQKLGAGSLTLSGTNSYGGVTTVNGGSFLNNGSLNSSAVNVSTGATVGGTGSFGGLVTLQTGAHLAPGAGVGSTSLLGGLTLNSGAVFDFQLGSTSDELFVSNGTLTGLTSGSVTLNLTNSGGFGAGSYTLVNFAGATNLNLDAGDFVFGTTIAGFSNSLAIVGGNTLVLTATAIPEPSTYGALAGAIVLGVASWRRRRARALRE